MSKPVSLGVLHANDVSKTYCVDSQSLGQKQDSLKTEEIFFFKRITKLF